MIGFERRKQGQNCNKYFEKKDFFVLIFVRLDLYKKVLICSITGLKSSRPIRGVISDKLIANGRYGDNTFARLPQVFT